jgi:hypothetical protein
VVIEDGRLVETGPRLDTDEQAGCNEVLVSAA